MTSVIKGRQSGARVSREEANAAYDAIRNRADDIEKISNSTGIKPKNIRKVKDHLIYDVHVLDRFERLGIPAVRARFQSDAPIAAAWNRLIDGSFNEADIQLLRHETAEAWYMRRHGPSYNAAHERAHARFPAPDLEGD